MDHDAPILPILFTQFRTSFSRTSGREHRSALSFHLSMFRRPSPPAVPHVWHKRVVPPFSVRSRRPSCLKYALTDCTNPAPRTSGREHRSALSFHLSMSWRPSPPAVPYVRYKRSVLPFLCGPGVRLARPAKRTDTRSAHFSLCFLYFFFCFCVRSDIVSIRQPLSASHLSRRYDWERAWFPPVARRGMVVWCFFVGCSGKWVYKKRQAVLT